MSDEIDLNTKENKEQIVTPTTNNLIYSNEIIKKEFDDNEKQISCQKDIEPEYLRKIFIGKLSFKANEEACRRYFSQYGDVLDFVIMRDSQGRSRGFAFVTYASSTMVDRFMAARPHKIDSREIDPKRAIPRDTHGKQDSSINSKKLFVGGIRDQTISEYDLNEYFAKYGNIIDAVLMKTNQGKSRGFGFVEFDDYDPVDKVVLEKTHIIKGNTLNVEKAIPKGQTKRHMLSRINKNDQVENHNGNVSVYPSRTSIEWASMNGEPEFGGINKRVYNNRPTPYSDNRGHDDGGMIGFGNSGFMNQNENRYGMDRLFSDDYYNLFGAFAGPPSNVDFGQNYGSTYSGGPMRRGDIAYDYGRNYRGFR